MRNMLIRDGKMHIESVSAIFIVALLSMLILANFFIGFILPLYFVVMVIAFVITTVYPRSGLYAIIVLTFVFERFFTLAPIVLGRNEYKLYPLDVLLIAIVLGTVWRILNGLISNKLRKIDLFVILFIFISALYFMLSAFVWNNEPSLAFSSAKNYGFYALLYFVIFFLIDSPAHFVRLGKFVIAGAISIIPFIVFGILTGQGLWSEYTPLSTEGVRTLAFTHGFYISLSLIVAINYLIQKKDKFSQILVFLVPIWIVGIVGSMMRHLWISLGISLIFLYFILSRIQKIELRKRVKIYGAGLLVISVMIVYAVSLFPHSQMNERLQGMTSVLGNRVVSIADSGDESIMWRSAVWSETLKEYKNSPIVGLGFGNKVFIEIGKYRDFIEVRNIHNSFLVLLTQMGIFGISLIAVLISILAHRVFKTNWKGNVESMVSQITLTVLLFYLVAFLFQPYLEANLLGIFFWINLGLLRSLYQLSHENIGN